MKTHIALVFGILFILNSAILQAQPNLITIDKKFVLRDVPFTLTLTAINASGSIDTTFSDSVRIDEIFLETDSTISPMTNHVPFQHGKCIIENAVLPLVGKTDISIDTRTTTFTRTVRVIPGYFSLLPPIIAIILALLLRQVLIALFSGIWLGAIFIHDYNPVIAFMRTLDTYLIDALSDPSHTAIIIFSMTLGGMVGVISKSGGTQGIVQLLARFANNRRGGQLAAWAMGLFIFFDDYANTLIVGNTMRPFTDKLRISREKLSYIVDSTAAPVASVAIISSWVGFQIGLIDNAFHSIAVEADPYLTFIRSIPYASYSLLAIVFVALVGISLRDMFSMRRAESRALLTGQVIAENAQPLADDKSLDIQAEENIPLRWYNALVPILAVIVITIIGLYYSGIHELGEKAATARLGEIIGAANSFDALMWASFSGALLAIILAVSQRILSISKALDAWLSGVKAMVIAMIILILAWSIGNICSELKTADYVIEITRGFLSPHMLPLITFIIAAFIGFSTGTSWATMAILIPIVIPTAHKLTLEAGIDPVLSDSIMLGTIAAVLSGSIFGDHSSPISDTTIMSSMASASDHIDHVRTQLPYALLVAVIACVTGYLPAGFGWNDWLSLLLGVVILYVILLIFGKRADHIGAPKNG
ncbi:Na+/H+ antiporter NhaC family protein [candidate division KSB1 bacterium]|nr:Na+/H+ antiporter NhaC family protein [candidate division KSB1 bacterium]